MSELSIVILNASLAQLRAKLGRELTTAEFLAVFDIVKSKGCIK